MTTDVMSNSPSPHKQIQGNLEGESGSQSVVNQKSRTPLVMINFIILQLII